MARLIKNIAVNVLGQVTLVVLGFVATKYVNRELGPDVLGLYYFSLAVAALGTALLEMGLSLVLVREIAGHQERDPGYVRAVVQTGSALFWGAFAVLALASWTLAPWLYDGWMTQAPLERASALLALRLFLLSAFLSLPRLLYSSILRGFQRFGTSNLIAVGASAVQQAGTLALLADEPTVGSFAGWCAAAAGLSVIASIAACAGCVGGTALLPVVSVTVLRRNFQFASRTFLTATCAALVSYADRLTLSTLMPIRALGHYGVSWTIVQKVRSLVSSATGAGFPALAEAHAQGDRDELLRRYRSLDDGVCFVTLPAFAAVAFGELPLMTFIFDAGVARDLLPATALLALGSYMNGSINTPYQLSLAVGKPEIVARLNVFGVLFIVPVTVGLVWTWGLVGAGLSWVVYHMFAYAYAMPRILRECIGVEPVEWLSRTARLIAIGLFSYSLTLAPLLTLNAANVLTLAIGYTVSTAGFLGLGYRLWMSPEGKQWLRQRFARLGIGVRSASIGI